MVGACAQCPLAYERGKNVTYRRYVMSTGNNLQENEIFMKTRNFIRGDMKHTVGFVDRVRYFFFHVYYALTRVSWKT